MLQNGQLCSRIMTVSVFFYFRPFSCKNWEFFATRSRKTSAMKQQQLIPVWRKVGHCNLKLLAKNTIFSSFHSRRSYIHDKLCIDPDLCEEYINRGLNEKLLPVLRHKSFAQNCCQSHTLNGCCAKLASNLDAKVGLFILSYPGKH